MKRSLHSTALLALLLAAGLLQPVAAQEVIFKDSFEGEQLKPAWTANAADDGGLVEPVRQITYVPDIPRTGNWALAMGRSSDSRSATTNTLDLSLNLSGKTDVTLEFWLRSEYDDTNEDDAILVSSDGGQSFTKVLDLRPGDWGARAYGLVVVDLGAAAAFYEELELNDQVVVRFRQSGLRDFFADNNNGYYSDGFFIDDVVVRGAPEYATLPFRDGFEADTLGPAWRVADPYNSDLTAPEEEAPWGFVMGCISNGLVGLHQAAHLKVRSSRASTFFSSGCP